ncbi:MAG: hypothetical protein ACP5M6_01550, partial [Methanobrevibacter sp.]
TDFYGLRYDEFISPIIAVEQELYKGVSKLSERLTAVEAQISDDADVLRAQVAALQAQINALQAQIINQ